jgi:hypothetical protein
MTDDAPIPSASAEQPEKHARDAASDSAKPLAVPVAGIGALGPGAIGGALAAVIGIAIVAPLLRRRKAKKAAGPAVPRRSRRRTPSGEG